jgi:hypothetical protein
MCILCSAEGSQVGLLSTGGLTVCFNCVTNLVLKSIADLDFYKNMRGESDE